MLNRKIEFIFIVLLLILFGGCGTMFDGKKETSSNKITIPKEVFIEIPKILKNSDSTEKKVHHQKNSSASQGYLKLKESSKSIENLQKYLKINLLLAEQIIDEVVDKCDEVSIGETCKIEKNSISFVFNDKFIDDVSVVIGVTPDDSLEEERGKSYPLGEIFFTQLDLDKTYQYILKIETTALSNSFEDSEETTQTIKWSKDEKYVFTHSTGEDDFQKNSMNIFYKSEPLFEKEMKIIYNFDDKTSINSEKSFLNIIDKNDKNETFKINSVIEEIFKIDDKIYKQETVSLGQISNKGGYLNISGIFNIRYFKENYLFDKEGRVISSKYCENSLVCDLNDSDTWLDLNSINIENIVYLNGKGGTLKSGVRYILFNPNIELKEHTLITKENQDMLFSSIVGELYLFEEVIYARLFSDEFIFQLDDLMMASINILNVNTSFLEPLEDKPKLYVTKN